MLYSLIKDMFFTKSKKIDTSNSIIFSIDENGKVHLDISINQTSDYHSEKFGYLLYLINEGFYLQSMIDAVVGLSDSKPEYTKFLECTIKSWNSHASKKDTHPININNPIVSPSKFGKT